MTNYSAICQPKVGISRSLLHLVSKKMDARGDINEQQNKVLSRHLKIINRMCFV